MHVHFGMSGAFRTSTRGEEPDARETTRLKLVGKDIVAQLSAMTVAHGGLGAPKDGALCSSPLISCWYGAHSRLSVRGYIISQLPGLR